MKLIRRYPTNLFIPVTLLLLFNFRAFSQTLDVKAFGAAGDGKTDDTRPIQAAIDAANASSNSVVYFPAGIYLIASYTATPVYLTNYCLRIKSGITFKGAGNTSVIKLADHIFDKRDTMANAHIFFGVNINHVKFTGLLIDMNGANNLVPENVLKNNMAIFINDGNGITLTGITIKNCSGSNMIAIKGNGRGLLIKNCFFYNGGNYVGIDTPNKYQVDFSFIYSEWDSTIVTNNHIEQQNIGMAISNYSGGIEIHGSYCYVSHNTIIGCNPGLYISSSWHPMEKTTITENKLQECLRGISFWVHYPYNNITVSNNYIELTYSRLQKPALISGIEIPNGNSVVYDFMHANNAPLNNLLIKGNTISALLDDTAADKTAGLVLHSLQNSRIENNTISGMNYGGIVIMGSKWGMRSVTIDNNRFSKFKTNNDVKAVAAYVVITDTYSNTNKDAPGIKDIYFTNNTFTGSKVPAFLNRPGRQTGKFLGAFVALPGAGLNEIHFERNVFRKNQKM